MTKTAYSGDPSNSDLDLIKFLIGDVEALAADIDITDEEIAYMFTLESNPYIVGAKLIEALVARLKKEGHAYADSLVREDLKQKIENYKNIAKTLRKRAFSKDDFIVTGQSASEETAFSNNSDKKQPLFKKGIHNA